MLLPELTDALAAMRGRLRDPDDLWCREVEPVVAVLLEAWKLRTTGESALAASEGSASRSCCAGAMPAMLKVTRTVGDRDVENDVLACWDGHHAVRLLERDDRRHARLLPRLGRSLADTVDPVTAMEVAGDLAVKLAVPAPDGLRRMSGYAEEIAAALVGASADRYGPLIESDVQAAAATFQDSGADQPDTVLHGDLQGSNVLRSSQGEWLVIDPLSMVGEPALEALTIAAGPLG